MQRLTEGSRVMCTLNARRPWEAVIMRVTRHRGRVLQSWGAEARLPHSRVGRAGQGIGRVGGGGQEGCSKQCRNHMCKAQRQVSRPVRGQREEREGGEEGTGGWAQAPAALGLRKESALGRATGEVKHSGVVVKCGLSILHSLSSTHTELGAGVCPVLVSSSGTEALSSGSVPGP